MPGPGCEVSRSMILTKYIAKSCILPAMKATNKADAIKELTYLLFEKKNMQSVVGPALDQIIAREATESTGIGKGIAVPHARVTGMKTLAAAVGRIPQGMDFMAIDRKPVHLILLICYPPTEQTKYLNFVATVAKLLSGPDYLKKMLEVQTADEMYGLLDEASQTFTEKHELDLKKIKADPAIARTPDAHADLILLARLQLCQEMLGASRTGKKEIQQRVEAIRALITPRILNHYDKLTKSRPPGLVPVEGDTCQGCFMKLATKFVQEIRQDAQHLHTCMYCSRYIYVV